ncbi:MAG: right-handed parallel beta-helix repeat-containing protein [Nitrospirae bacterium]|nr:right-handed parallel beta-helix repeat-containing protein [Nitrospirota bacterium]
MAVQLALLCVVACMTGVGSAQAATYYVACDTGRDANDGLSELRPWQSAAKVATFPFLNGDVVFFKKGCRWEDVSIKISKSLHFGAYGEGSSPPQLLGSRRASAWTKIDFRGVFVTEAALEQGVPSRREILIVHDDKNGRFYSRTGSLDSVDAPGKFFHDVPGSRLYVFPLPDVDLSRNLHIASKPHVLEFQRTDVERVVVDGLSLSFANEYAIGFWYQSSGTNNGSLTVSNCSFFGNAYQAIHIGGTNTFQEVDILKNTVTANGNEAFYIRYLKRNEEGEVIKRLLRISGNTIGGQGFGWRSEGPESAANGDGIDIKAGVAAAVIDHNMVFDVAGMYGIGVQSSNVLIEHNTVGNIRMWNAPPETSVAGIFVDPYDSKGTVVVRNNKVAVSGANGIVIRGDATRRPAVEIYENDIAVEAPYFAVAFTSQNVTNTVIRNNRIKGGQAALFFMKPCCPPSHVEIHDNDFRGMAAPFVTAQDLSAGVRFYSNSFCFSGLVDPAYAHKLAGNAVSSGCEVIQPQPPQGILVK